MRSLTKILNIPVFLLLTSTTYAAGQGYRGSERLMGDAKAVAADSFPHLCGDRGEYCGFAIDPRRECAKEFMMNYPVSLLAPSGKRGLLWITLDGHRRVVSVSLTKAGACRNELPPVSAG